MDDAKRCCGQWYDERKPQRYVTADLSVTMSSSDEKMLCYMVAPACL